MPNYADESLRISHQFEFYLIALAFTVAGFSIQTAPSVGLVQTTFEFISWVSLIFSGVLGIKRLEYFGPIYRAYTHRSSLKNDLAQMQSADFYEDMQQGIERTKAKLDKFNVNIKKEERKIRRNYPWQKWALFTGLACLAVSRLLGLLAKLPATVVAGHY